MGKIPAYRPRWLSAFYELIDRLPVPGWLLVAVISIAIGLVMHLAAWNSGALAPGAWNSYLAMQGFFITVIPSVWRLLDRYSQRAVHEYCLATGRSASQERSMLIEFLSLPAVGGTLVFVLGFASGIYEALYDSSLPEIGRRVLPLISQISWPISNAFLAIMLLRAILQIGRINQYFNQLKLNVFNPSPVYVFSRYGANFAGTILLAGHGLVLLALPEYYFSANGVFFLGMLSLVGLVLFFAPLTSINGRMRREKDRLLSQLGEDQMKINQRLHAAMGKQSLAGVNELRTAAATLKEQREVLAKLPTWPWQSDALRNLLTPMLIPVLVFLAQRLLAGLFGL